MRVFDFTDDIYYIINIIMIDEMNNYKCNKLMYIGMILIINIRNYKLNFIKVWYKLILWK